MTLLWPWSDLLPPLPPEYWHSGVLLPQSIPLHEAGAHLLPGASQPASVPGIEYSIHIPSQETRADWPHLTSFHHGFGLIVLTLPLKESCVSLKRLTSIGLGVFPLSFSSLELVGIRWSC